jgi:hypothetical protein
MAGFAAITWLYVTFSVSSQYLGVGAGLAPAQAGNSLLFEKIPFSRRLVRKRYDEDRYFRLALRSLARSLLS